MYGAGVDLQPHLETMIWWQWYWGVLMIVDFVFCRLIYRYNS